MKQSTINKYTNLLNEADKADITLKKFCEKSGNNYNTLMVTFNSLRKLENKSESIKELIALYDKVVSKHHYKDSIETDDRSEVSYVRDENGKIKYYEYKIYRRNKTPIIGTLTRDEMNMIHRLYSYYGDSLQQRVISRRFVDLSLVDFKRILRAFNITKASAPFAPHMIEEYSEDELRDIQLREKENGFLRKAEEDLIKNNEKLLKKYAQENIELKREIRELSFNVTIPDNLEPIKIEPRFNSNNYINLYVADLHLGSMLTSGALYKENINYGYDEAKRRLSEIINKLNTFGEFDTINLVLMGDNVDCCGFEGKTARLDHTMPENMDAREQANKFLELMMWFIDGLLNNGFCNHMNIYSVPFGNHSGNFEYMINKALLAMVEAKYPDVKTKLWEDFFGVFKFNNHTFVCCHGKNIAVYIRNYIKN